MTTTMNKMKPYSYFLLALVPLLALIMAACDTDDAWRRQGSGFLITLTDDVAVETRSTPYEIGAPVADDFHLLITNDKTGETLYNGSYTADYISAPPSDYTLTATFGSNPELAYDDPYYYGTATATVEQSTPTQVEIPCSVANCLLSIEYSNPDLFEALYSTYGVTVAVGHSSLELTPDTGDKSAYFQDGATVTLTFFATVKDAGDKAVSMEIESDDLPTTYAAGTHTILTLTSNTQTSGTILTVEKVEVETVSVEETIPLSWLPKPTVSDAYSITYVETEEAPEASLIALNAGSPLQDLQLTIEAHDPQYTDLNGTYLLSEMTTDELAAFAAAGITLPAIDGSTKSANLDLSAWVATLQTDAGAETVNTVTVNVKANDRWSTESDQLDADDNKQPGEGTTYTITVVKPDFTVSVQDYNIWSKEFTADEITVNTGDKEKLESDLVYQYSDDGGATWTDFNDNDEMRQYFEEHPEQKEYLVRALYRGAVASSNTADVELETPTQLPNSDMESWYMVHSSHNSSIDPVDSYEFFPYEEGDTDPWWATNDKRSMDGIYVIFSWAEVAFSPCVSFRESPVHGGSHAAYMYTSGHGGYYASTNQIVYPKSAFAGSLFIGDYTYSDHSGTIVPGHDYDVRPTQFSFWYYYIPYTHTGSDQFKAYIELKNGDDVIATGTYIPDEISEESTEYQQAVVDLDYSDLTKKATSIYVQFLSTTIAEGDFESDDFRKSVHLTFPDPMGDWKAHIGSQLYIDDLYLDFSK